jgi:ribosomal protein L44E
MGSIISAISSTEQTPASASISSQQGKKPVKGVAAIGKNIAADVKMGFAAFGKGSATGTAEQKQKQIDALVNAGYTKEAALDYQKRTAETIAENKRQSMMNKNDYGNDDSPAPAPVSAPAPAPAPAPTTTTPTPPPAPAPISEVASAPEAGSTEAEVIASAERRRGRASTIETTPQGLITAAKTTKKKSLMNKMIA